MKTTMRHTNVEALESRRLLAGYAAAAYFPMRANDFWDYTGSADGIDADVERIAKSSQIAGSATIRFEDGLRMRDEWAGEMSRDYSRNSKGVYIHAQSLGAGQFGSAEVTLKSPVRFLNANMADGQVLRWSAVPLDAKVQVPDYGQLSARGTDSGFSRVVGTELLDIGEGEFIAGALKVMIDHTQSLDAEADGSHAHLDAHIIETIWLARGIGIARFDATIDVTATVDGESESERLQQSFVLDGSNLMLPVLPTLDERGVLTLSGTVAADSLSVFARGRQITVSNGALSQTIDRNGVKGVNVLAGDGNDVISIGSGIYGATIDGGAGNDVITGSAGNDLIRGRAGNDRINGGAGNDRIYGDSGADMLFGGAGNDRLYGGASRDRFDGGAGSDSASDAASEDILLGVES